MAWGARGTRSHINAVVDWLDDRGYDVVFKRGAESQIHPEGEKEVWIDSRPSLECQLYTLLHEAGHLRVSKRHGYRSKFSHGYVTSSKNSLDPKCRTVMHWVHKVHEEFEAWEEGLKLARELGIPIDRRGWESNRCPALMSYFREAVTKRPKGKPGSAKKGKKAGMVTLYWLDDERPAPEGWVWIHEAESALQLLEAHAAEGTSGNTVWSLDHDLGEGRGTGYDVASWVEERAHTDATYDPPRLLLHTANPVGRDRMRQTIESIKRAVLARKETGRASGGV